MEKAPEAKRARERLVEMGGRTAQELGLGRIVGKVLVYLYLQPRPCSLDLIGEDLGLSKAAVSIAARQLQNLGLINRVWEKGDRRSYYRTADHIGTALRKGLLAMVRRRLDAVDVELREVCEDVESAAGSPQSDRDLRFLAERVKRAKVLHGRVSKLLDSPLLKLLN